MCYLPSCYLIRVYGVFVLPLASQSTLSCAYSQAVRSHKSYRSVSLRGRVSFVRLVPARGGSGSPYIINIVFICLPSLPAFPAWPPSLHSLSTRTFHCSHVRSSHFSRSIKNPAVHEPPRWSAYPAIFEREASGTKGVITVFSHSCAPTGPKTVFFWAPLMKWCLVLAGVKDMGRPADKLSVSQNFGELFRRSARIGHVEHSALAALAATGFIWVRYSFVIIPVNYSLAAVCLLGYVLEVVWRAHSCLGQLLRRGHWPWAIGAYRSVRPIFCSFSWRSLMCIRVPAVIEVT